MMSPTSSERLMGRSGKSGSRSARLMSCGLRPLQDGDGVMLGDGGRQLRGFLMFFF